MSYLHLLSCRIQAGGNFFRTCLFRFAHVFCVVFCLLVLLGTFFSLPASASSVELKKHGIGLEIPDEYVLLNAENVQQNKSLLEKLHIDAENFSKNLEETGTLLFAVTEDGKHQINFKMIENNISKGTFDLSTLPAEERESVKNSIVSNLSETENMTVLGTDERTVSNTTFYRVRVRVSTSTGEFCFVQYFSIFNSRFYALVYYNSSSKISDDELKQADSVFQSLKFQRKTKATIADTGLFFQIAVTALIIAAVGALAVYILYTFVRDARRSRLDNEASLGRISRRKYK